MPIKNELKLLRRLPFGNMQQYSNFIQAKSLYNHLGDVDT